MDRTGDDFDSLFNSMVILPMVYGAVHLAAWNYEFPTQAESILWKVAAFMIGSAMWLWAYSGQTEVGQRERVYYRVTDSLILYVLVLSRAYIVVEAFISLRAVPIGVYWMPSWLQMIPHV